MSRTPKPTALRKLEGNREHRRYPDGEPEPDRVTPDCPPDLDDVAREEWERLAPIIARMRILTEADGIALAELCVAYSISVDAQRQYQKLKAQPGGSALLLRVNVGKDGTGGSYQVNPLIGIIREQSNVILRHLREFGLTPAARTKIHVEEAARPSGGMSIAMKMCG